MQASPLEIHKFAGIVLRDAESVRAAAELAGAAARRGSACVVCAALAGVSDKLLAGRDGRSGHELALYLEQRHRSVLAGLKIPERDPAYAAIDSAIADVDILLRSGDVLKGLSPRAHDRLVAIGDQMAVAIFTAALRQLGVNAIAVSADTFLETTDDHGQAEPLTYIEDRRTAAVLRPMLEAGQTPVVTAGIGRGPDGSTRSLGRGGDDLTATLLAGALAADEITFWADVDGVRTADPAILPHAARIDHLHYREAAELSYFGGKAIHPRAMIPVVAKRIPVRIRDARQPDADGTRIDGLIHRRGRDVKAVSAVRDLALISVEGCGMAGVPGIAARVFDALAAGGVSITMISQSSAESSICFAVPADDVATVERVLRHEFRTALALGVIDDIVIRRDVGVVAAVGAGMRGQVGVTAATGAALCRAGVNILAIAQGASELSISYAVDDSEVPAAVRAMHDVTRPVKARTPVPRLDLILVGLGRVGRHLVQLVARDGQHRICAIADSRGYACADAGFDAAALDKLIAAKAAGQPLPTPGDAHTLLAAVRDTGFANPVLVDCTASSAMTAVATDALAAGLDVVTANKEILADEDDAYQRMRDAAQRGGGELRGEATVGAGLPIFSTLESLSRTGDAIASLEASLSGTLAHILMRLQAGATLPAALKEAVDLGYTEPDPFEDLSGRDVARKALILARLSGLSSSSRGVAHESLITLGDQPPTEAELIELGAQLAARAKRAADNGQVLRYVARVTADEISVGLREVAADSALGRALPGDVCIAIRTQRQPDHPLTISGAGAGLASTCQGVLADLLRIADERFAQRSRP